MVSAKAIKIAPIKRQHADALVKQLHYSGKVVPNSQLHFGVFLNNKLEGVMQFGASMDKRRTKMLVEDTPWNGFIELNRMAFSDRLPKNSESRAIAIAVKLIKKHYPHIQWIISFADATQCGDGAIYRASGFCLTSIKINKQMLKWKGKVIAKKTLDNANYPKINGKYYSRYLIETGQAVPLPGYQLRYVYFIHPTAKQRLTVPIVPFSRIAEMGASMYRGQSVREKQANVGTTDTATVQHRSSRSNSLEHKANLKAKEVS